jgi:hypothetical protein
LVDHAKIGNDPWPDFIATAKKKKVRVIPTVMWGDGAAIHKILSDSSTRIALENEIANLVKQKNFDGIDIDFEAKKAETRDYFSTFLKGLYQRLPGKWVYCTVEARQPLEDRFSPGATIPVDATDYANDYTQMNKYCDRVEIMAYDQGTIDLRLNVARSAPYAPVGDPDLFPFWHSSQSDYPGSNLALFSDRPADKLLEDARAATTDEARTTLYKKFQDILVNQLPAIFLFTPNYNFFVNKNIKGINVDRIVAPSDRYDNLSDWYIKTSWKWKTP